jgi:hypothetical protein
MKLPVLEEEFVLANRAFEHFTLAERRLALEKFARLRYPSIADRFFEAVHQVILEQRTASVAEPDA